MPLFRTLMEILVELGVEFVVESGLNRLWPTAAAASRPPHVCPRCNTPEAQAQPKRRIVLYRCSTCAHIWRRSKVRSGHSVSS